MSLPQFRPRSPTEIVDAAIQLGRRHYQPLLVLSAIIAIPNLIIGLASQWMVPAAIQAGGQMADAADVALLLGVSLVSAVWLLIGFGALVASTASAYVDGRALEPMAALRMALGRAVPLVAANLLAYLLVTLLLTIGFLALVVAVGAVVAVIGGERLVAGEAQALTAVASVVAGFVVLAALFVAGILLWSRYASITAAVMLEGRGTAAAIRRSSELTRGNVWRTAGVVLIMGVLYLVAFLTSWVVLTLVVRDANLSANVAGVLVLALYPFLGAMLTLLYYDLRIRREGYDLELMARALDGAGGGLTTEAPPAADRPA